MNAFDVSVGLGLLIVICFGLFGNVMSFFVWTTGRRCKKSPGSIYLRALAISDTIALCIPAMNETVSLLSGTSPQHQNIVICKIESTGRHFGLLVSSWIVACFSIDRTLSIFKANATPNLDGKTRTIGLIISIFSVNLLLNIPYGIVHSVMLNTSFQRYLPLESSADFKVSASDENGTLNNKTFKHEIKYECSCDPSSFFSFLNWYHTWFMDFVLIFIIPFTLITVSNILVMIIVIFRRKTFQIGQRSKAKGVTIRAVCVSILHCVTTGPFCIAVLIPGHLDRALAVKYSLDYYVNKLFLLLAFLNHAMNYVLYSVVGTDFKRDCMEIIRTKSSVVNPGNTVRINPQNTQETKTIN